jgi:ribosomal protein L37AE/L43A
MQDPGGARQQFWSKWPVLVLPASPPESRQDASEPSIATSPAGGASAGQQSKTGVAGWADPVVKKKTTEKTSVVLPHKDPDSGSFQGYAAHLCAECGEPIVGRRRDARFCGGSCRTKHAGKAFRQRQKATVGLRKDANLASLPVGKIATAGSAVANSGKSAAGSSRRNGGLKDRRRISDSAAVTHPGEPERPFTTDESEPDWVTEELRPPRLAYEREPPAPEPRPPFWRLD